MGIKSLTQSIQKYSPDSIQTENLYKLSGKKVAVDASLIIYQQLLNKTKIYKNNDGKMTNHISGIFYKIMNYISLNIELVFVFDGKPPDNKQECINIRKEKSNKAKELEEKAKTNEEKEKFQKASLRITKEIIDDVKKLLTLLGITYIHPEVGEGEAYASELCRVGYVDYVLTEDMDTLAYGCPKLIRRCIDRSNKRKDIVSIFDYEKMIHDFDMDYDEFLEFCILCGCDYCPSVPKVGHITAIKLFKEHKSINEIMEKTKFAFPENYKKTFQLAKENFLLYRDKLNVDKLEFHTSTVNIEETEKYLVNEINMNEKRVQNALKKFNNNYNGS